MAVTRDGYTGVSGGRMAARLQREESPGSSKARRRVTPGEGRFARAGTLGKAPQRTDRPRSGQG